MFEVKMPEAISEATAAESQASFLRRLWRWGHDFHQHKIAEQNRILGANDDLASVPAIVQGKVLLAPPCTHGATFLNYASCRFWPVLGPKLTIRLKSDVPVGLKISSSCMPSITSWS